MKKIRLGIDCRAASGNMSGVGRYVLNIVKEIASTDRFQMVLLVRNDSFKDFQSLSNIELIPLQENAQSIHYVNRLHWEQIHLNKLLDKLKLDLYHATWNYGIPLIPRCPTVLTLHDLLPIEFPGEFGSRSWRIAYLASQYIALYRASKIIAVSQYTKRQLMKYSRVSASKVSVILEGVEENFIPSDNASMVRKYILYVGGYGERKNVGNLLRAFGEVVRKSIFSFELHMTGSLERMQVDDVSIYNHLDASTKERIKFIGFVDDSDLPRLYQGAAMLVFPSLGEGFGFPPLEAMACATPVITTNCGSIPEVVGDAARIVSGFDPQSIAQGIIDVASSNDYREKLIERGLVQARTLSWKACSAATMKVYEEIASCGGQK